MDPVGAERRYMLRKLVDVPYEQAERQGGI